MPDSLIDLAGLRVGGEEFLAAVLATAGQPVWVIDPDGLVRFANPAAISALGYERADELSGRESHSTIHYRRKDGAPFPAEECPLRRTLASGEKVTVELDWFVRRDGSMFPVSYVSVPLEMAGGRGAVVTFTDIEDRLRPDEALGETDAALASQHASLRDELARLADEQAALRRVATLVAEAAPAPELFGAVTQEVGQLLRTDAAAMIRYEHGVMTAVGNWTAEGVNADTEVGRQWPLEGDSLAPRIVKTGQSARIDDWREVPGPVGDYARTELGLSSSVGSPILVGGRVWGNIVVHSTSGRLPSDTEERLAGFTGLVATAIANSEAQAEVERLADEQAALRRVATLVARGVPPSELFVAVVAEVGRLLGADLAGMINYGDEGTISPVATWAAVGDHPEVRGRWSLEGDKLATTISRTGRPAREDDWDEVSGPIAVFVREHLEINSSVGSPVMLEGRVWGALFVHSTSGDALPAGTEAHLSRLHGARRDRDLQQRGAGQGGAAGGRAGGPAARGDPGRAGVAFGRGVRSGGRGAEAPAVDGGNGDLAIRGGRHGHDRRELERGLPSARRQRVP